MDNVRSSWKVILIDDLNGKVGRRNNHKVVGMHGESE